MNTKQDILKNSMLNEAEIDYYQKQYKQILRDVNTARTILRQSEESKDFIEQLNRMESFNTQRNKEGKVVSRGLKQFLDTPKQRDMLVAVWSILNSNREDFIKEFGIDLEDKKGSFNEKIKKIVQETRSAAIELNKKNPSPEEVEKVKSGELETPEDETDETPSPEESEEEPESEEDEPESEEDEPESEEDEKPPFDKEEGGKIEKKKGSDLVDTNDFPPPKDTLDKLRSYKEEKIQAIEDAYSRIENPQKEQIARYQKAKSSLEKTLNNATSNVMDRQRRYDNYPTSNSAMKDSTAAKKIVNKAKISMNDIASRFVRSEMPGRVKRAIAKSKVAAGEIGKAGKVVADRTKTKRDALKSAASKGSDIAKRGAAKAGEAAESVISKQKEKMAANAIEKYLGSDKRNEYLSLLQKGKTEEAEQIRQEGIEAKNKKTSESKQNKEQQRLERLKKQTQKENYILRNYSKKLNELADNPATREDKEEDTKETKEILKIAKSPLGKSKAEEYKELMKGSSQEKKKAIEMLQKAEQEEEKTKDDLGLETKKQNESIKRVLRALYS